MAVRGRNVSALASRLLVPLVATTVLVAACHAPRQPCPAPPPAFVPAAATAAPSVAAAIAAASASVVRPPESVAERRKLAEGDRESLWWSYRFFETAIDRDSVASDDDKDAAADAFVRLAVSDPEWAFARLEDPNPWLLPELMTEERMTRVLTRLHFTALREEARLRASLLSACAHWDHETPLQDKWYRQAWQELQRVPEVDRDWKWKKAAIDPTAVADYPRFRELAGERISSMNEGYSDVAVLREAIPVAARERDWSTFDAWVKVWWAAPEPWKSALWDAHVITLEGIHALDEKRTKDAVAAMRRLLDVVPRAASGELSLDWFTALPKRLRDEKRALDLCDAFDAAVKKRKARPR